MASLIVGAGLMTAGAAVNPFVAALMIAAASYVDQTIIMPAFMSEDEKVPEFGSWDVNYAEEGSPGRYVYGQYNRLPGHIIMAGTPFQTGKKSGSSKRGGIVQYTWWSDIAQVTSFNPNYRVDRIDMEGNISYLRDPARDWKMEFYPNSKITWRTDFSTVIWQRTGSKGSNSEWSLMRWLMTIENEHPAEEPDLARFMPGEHLRAASKDVPTQTGGGKYVLNSMGAEQYRDNAWGGPSVGPGFLILSSRNEGNITRVDPATGKSTTVQRNRLVLDILGEKQKWGMLRRGDRTARSLGSGRQDSFFQNVHQSERDNFQPNGRDNPFHYQEDSPRSWPRTGSSSALHWIDFDYFPTVRNWALDVLKNNPPVAGTDYLEHHGRGDAVLDPVYTKLVGTKAVPSLPNVSWFSFRNLNISRFGNRIPHMHFYVDARKLAGDPETPQDLTAYSLLGDLLRAHVALPSYRYELYYIRDNPSDEILGFNFPGLKDTLSVMASVLLAQDVHPVETNGKVTFINRSDRATVYLGWQHLDAREWNTPPSQMLEIKDQDHRAMPARLHLKFMDIDRDMQAGDVYAYKDNVVHRWSQRHSPQESAQVSTRQMNIPYVTMSSGKALTIANRVLNDTHEMKQRVKLRLPCWYVTTTETDVIKLSGYDITPGGRGVSDPIAYPSKYMGEDFYILVEQVDIGADFYVEIEGFVLPDDPTGHASASDAEAESGGPFSKRDSYGELADKLGYRPPTLVVPLDIPPLLDQHVGTTGLYFAYTSPGAAHSQPSGSLIEDIGDGDNWLEISTANKSSLMGVVVDKLHDGATGVLTTASDLVVDLLSIDLAGGALESTTDVGLLNGDNLAAVGQGNEWEIIQFKTATEEEGNSFATDNRWRLTELRRGLRGTERFTAAHDTGEWFVLLNAQRMHFHPVDNTLIGLSRRYKVIQSGMDVDSAPSSQVTLEGNTSLPVAVANLVAWRKSNGDVVFTWNRRTRARYRTFGTQIAPLCEATESYDVVIDLGTDRTINITAETGTYTAAMQSTDSKSGLEITATVYQRDSVRGRGAPSVIIVAQTQVEVGVEGGNVLGAEDGRTVNTPMGGGMD